MTLRFVLVAGCAGLLSATFGCSSGSSAAADAQTIKTLNDEWSKAGAAKDSAKFVSYYSADATVMLPNEPILKGMENIKAVAGPMMQDPNFSLTFTTDKVEVSGVLGYTQGAVSVTTTGRDGKPFQDKGKYLTVWKKQDDGSWKATEDIFNSDLPPAGPPDTGKK